MFHNIEFADPGYFWLLLLIPAAIAWYWWKHKNNFAKMRISGLDQLSGAPISLRQRFIHLPFVLKMIVLSLLIVAIARPQTSS